MYKKTWYLLIRADGKKVALYNSDEVTFGQAYVLSRTLHTQLWVRWAGPGGLLGG